MVAQTIKFFRPETELQQLQRIVVILSAATALCFISLMLYAYEHRSPVANQTVDKIGMLILLDKR